MAGSSKNVTNVKVCAQSGGNRRVRNKPVSDPRPKKSLKTNDQRFESEFVTTSRGGWQAPKGSQQPPLSSHQLFDSQSPLTHNSSFLDLLSDSHLVPSSQRVSQQQNISFDPFTASNLAGSHTSPPRMHTTFGQFAGSHLKSVDTPLNGFQRISSTLAPIRPASHVPPQHDDYERSPDESGGASVSDEVEDSGDEIVEETDLLGKENEQAPLQHVGSSYGANDASQHHEDPSQSQNERQFIMPVGKSSFHPYIIIRRIMPDCIATYFEPGWTTVSTCAPNAREVWFSAFKRLFCWEPANDTWVKQNFYRKAAKLLRDQWNYCKKSGKGPICSTPEGTRLAKEKWSKSEHYKIVCLRNKDSWRGLVNQRGHSMHRMGPRPAHVAKEILSKQLGREATLSDVYRRYKIMDNDKHLDPDGPKIIESLDEIDKQRKELESAGTLTSPVDEVAAYAKAVGVTRRSKLPRLLGDLATTMEGSSFALTQVQSQTSVSSQQPDVEKLGKKLDEFTRSFTDRFATQEALLKTREVELAKVQEELISARAREEELVRATAAQAIAIAEAEAASSKAEIEAIRAAARDRDSIVADITSQIEDRITRLLSRVLPVINQSQ